MSEVRNVNVGSGSGGNDGCREGQQGKPQAKRDYRKWVKKRKYTLEMKREMLEKIKSGARTCEIMRRFNCPESTIRSPKKNKEALTAFVNTSSLVELQQIEAELSDSDQALPANQEEEEEEEEEEMVEDLQEMVGQHQQQPTIEEMLEEDEGQEEPQATQEDDVKPGEPTTRQLTEVLTTIARFSEQRDEALITRHLRKAQSVIIALANITLGDDDGTTNDDIEVLGDLLVEELPQDFEGFDAEVRGGVEERTGR
ncbi:putative CENP-B N-terminal DNA-binding domain-containing protein 16 [Homarus americanus]|uniref:Putative CENP-B N-terminal DNA-binding domain-containing protein 16 n=1 Tax=Homarus americanus TaxID=6706 RepID=A0A8J5MX48_HOMAM|nr:putative CENP-B N-terminal DNA-binding domain-containing protein 16 [Homarus americanus]